MTLNETADPLDDAVLAARLFALAPTTFKGMVLRGNSPAREALVVALGAGVTLRRMPGHIDDERLLGGIDLAASLSAGRPIRQTGLIEEARGGALLAGMAERMDGSIAGRLAQALDEGQAALVLLDDATEPEEAPPASLTERLAFACDLSTSRRWQGVALAPAIGALAKVAPLDDDALRALAATADALGVESVRALIFAGEAARGLAALDERGVAEKADLTGAVRLVLAPRATRLPPQEQDAPPEDQPPPPEGERDDQSDSEQQQQELDLRHLVEAAKAAIGGPARAARTRQSPAPFQQQRHRAEAQGRHARQASGCASRNAARRGQAGVDRLAESRGPVAGRQASGSGRQ